ncbi:hypothetical protein HUJ05_008793 [Dendroctonus ponderosae]|nr:hypothetical protein HUJ05_008793 [Dendroctonus ponderosae]
MSIWECPDYTYDPYNESSFLQDTDDDEDTPADPKILRNLVASLLVNEDGDKWWYITEECSAEDDNYFYYLKDLVHNSCEHLVLYTFNERVFSNTMSYVTQSGIIGLYLLYFMMVIGIIRGCRVSVGEIWIEDLPLSDDIMRKCLEVYIARDMHNFELEEELFAELIFIMRSRELLIKLSRLKDSGYNPPIVAPVAKRKQSEDDNDKETST